MTQIQNSNVPKLRFPGFEGEWKHSIIGRRAKVTTGSRDTKNRKDDGAYPFFVRSDNIERIDTWALDCEAVITSGDGVGVGKNFHYINGKFDFHQRVYAIYDFAENLDGKFFFQFFKEGFFRRVMRLSAKNSVDSVRMSMITDMPLSFPTLPEQRKIADFLGAVDTKIAQLAEKKRLLEDYKKGCMQQLFSQEIRFKDGNGRDFPDWEEKRLRELFERVRQKNNIGNENVLTISAQAGLVNQLDYFNHSVAAKDTSGYYLLKKGDFAYNKSYSKGYPMGAIKRLKYYDQGIVSTLYICFRAKNPEVEQFYECYFDSGLQNHWLAQITQEGARNHGLLNMAIEDVFDMPLPYPHPAEQRKIADFLSALDRKIDLVGKELEQAKTFKKGLLQQMFV